MVVEVEVVVVDVVVVPVAVSLDLRDDFESVHNRHLYVEDHDVEFFAGLLGFLTGFQGLRSPADHGGVKPYAKEHLLEDITAGGVVVDRQNLQAFGDGGQFGRNGFLGLFLEGEAGREVKRRSDGVGVGFLPRRVAFDPNASFHELDEIFRDRQAQAGPSVLPRGGAVGLREGLKNEVAFFGGYSDSRVADGEPERDSLPFLCLGLLGDAQYHFAFRGEFHGVSDEVDDDLA